jgi:cyclophilin family peptidyl-prolyl cis-trans isomerase
MIEHSHPSSSLTRSKRLLVAGLSLAFASACQPTAPATGDGSAPAKQTPKADPAKADADAGAAKADDSAPKAEPAPDPVAAAANCCLFCMDGKSPCGDKCIEAGATCEGAAEGCACEASVRPPTKFKKGDRVLKGMIRADVAAFNKAQGDPVDGFFSLEMAFEGAPELADKSKGKLFGVIKTDLGNIRCELFEEQAPLTVANFVGLARGKRPWYDKKTKQWAAKTYYDNTLIHRVIDGFMVQMGDHTSSGRGGPGYMIPDEFDPSLKHSGPGTLSMANRNRPDPRSQKLRVDPKTGQTIGNTGSSQFFVTIAPGKKAGYLDGRHTVFGKCRPDVALKIGKVPTRSTPPALKDRPVQDVKLHGVSFERAAK